MANEMGTNKIDLDEIDLDEIDSEEIEETNYTWKMNSGNWVIGGVGAIVGFLIAYLIHYLPWKADKHIERSERKNTKKLILTWNSVEYHIHHWITFSLVTMLLLMGYYGGGMLVFGCVGLSTGAVVEDFLFKGIFRFNISNGN